MHITIPIDFSEKHSSSNLDNIYCEVIEQFGEQISPEKGAFCLRVLMQSEDIVWLIGLG